MKKTKWHRICSGLYQIGNITVHQIYYSKEKYFMWHVVKDEHTVVTWAYLKNAKEAALELYEKEEPMSHEYDDNPLSLLNFDKITSGQKDENR